MFIAKNEEILNTLFEKKNVCEYSNNYVTSLVKFMAKNWTPYIIDSIKRNFGKRGLSHSELNHVSIKICILYVDGIHGTI